MPSGVPCKIIYDFTVVNVVPHVHVMYTKLLAGRWLTTFTNKCITNDCLMTILIEQCTRELGRILDDCHCLTIDTCRLVFYILHITYALIQSSVIS